MDKKVPLPQYIDNLTKEYGDIMTVWLGAKPTVILSSMEAVKAAFIDNQHDFASRPDSILCELTPKIFGFSFYNPKIL